MVRTKTKNPQRFYVPPAISYRKRELARSLVRLFQQLGLHISIVQNTQLPRNMRNAGINRVMHRYSVLSSTNNPYSCTRALVFPLCDGHNQETMEQNNLPNPTRPISPNHVTPIPPSPPTPER
jgi:hypothetical protein